MKASIQIRSYITAIIVCFTATAFSQQPETKFIRKRSITWAAFISDSFHFSDPNLSLAIRQQVDAGKITIDHPNFDSHVYLHKTYTSEELQTDIGGLVEVHVYDDGMDGASRVEQKVISGKLFSPEIFDSLSANLVFVEQLLYLQKKRLRSHVSWVSPSRKVVTNSGLFLGYGYLFNAYHNSTEKIRKHTRRTAISLGTTSKVISDSAIGNDMMKQWYGQNFARAIWPSLSSGKVEIYRMDSMKPIGFADLKDNMVNDYLIEQPVDAIELIKSTDLPPLDPAVFTKAELIQEWFYNPKKEVVFNEVKGFILYAHKTKNGITDVLETPVIKVLYK